MMTQLNLSILCQPDDNKSCGACCGLYNYADSSRLSLEKRLRLRTTLYHKIVKSPQYVETYAQAILANEDSAKRCELIYCCEYLGFLDKEEKRVGCLLHPQQNGGVDLRACSFYGEELCAGHTCPSHQFLTPLQTESLVIIIDDWYLYGLCLTDIDLVKSYFKLLSDRLGEELQPKIFDNSLLRQIALDFFQWKVLWPFRSEETNRLGKYYFDGSLYKISHIDYEMFGLKKSPLDAIFLSFCSAFNSAEEIALAENMVMSNMEHFILTYKCFF
ncbi:MAG TPA: hypothetical protein PKZ12_01835 [Smithellaceae bacterium]|nr:hypothetical protein [Smithellaceae bacterium]